MSRLGYLADKYEDQSVSAKRTGYVSALFSILLMLLTFVGAITSPDSWTGYFMVAMLILATISMAHSSFFSFRSSRHYHNAADILRYGRTK